MENTLLNRLPVAAAELHAQRNADGEIIDFIWKNANAFGVANIGMPHTELIGKPIGQLTDIFRNNNLIDLLKEAVETQRYCEHVTPIGYNEGPLSGKSFYVSLAPQGDTCVLVAHDATKLQSHTQGLPVIALTANAMAGDREKHIALGMDGYISKPVGYDDMLSEIHRVLQKSENLRVAS